MRRLVVVLALVLLPALVSAQVTSGSPFAGGSGGSFTGGDVAGQTNFCGPDATTNVEIGSCANDANAGTGGTSVVIGNAATNTGNAANAVVVGSTASVAGADGIAIGRAAILGGAGLANIRIGAQGTCSSTLNNLVVIGNQAGCTTNTADSLVVGATATNTASNQFVAGGNGFGYLDVYFGEGVANTTAASWTLRGTGGSGADNAGGSLTIAPGISTGTAVGGQVVIQRAQRNTTGSAAQTLLPAYISCPVKILSTVSATAQAIATITTTTTTGGSVEMSYTTTACSGTTCDADAGSAKVAWNNNAGTVAAAMSAAYGTVDSDATGTLATTPTVTVGTSVVTVNFTPTWVTIVPTTVHGYATFLVNGQNSVVCQ